ncbi:MAG TPA: nucleoside monophosphate kinase [Candidatus Paceibacterota bacterium]|nr:nucleoside monophosphate kinase [Candidatus Paceibacterota bacterium]
MIGRSCCGKGTQADLIEKYAYGPSGRITTSDLIAEFETPEQKNLRELEGKLLDGIWVAGLVCDRVQLFLDQGKKLLILDGSARTAEQTRAILEFLQSNSAIRSIVAHEYDVSPEECEHRMIHNGRGRLDEETADRRKTKLGIFDQNIWAIHRILQCMNVQTILIKNPENRSARWVFNESLRMNQRLNELIRSKYRFSRELEATPLPPTPKRYWEIPSIAAMAS